MDSRLELRLADTSPKCGTCAFYKDEPTIGAAKCSRHDIGVLNLSVCTDWTERLELEAVKE